MPRAVIRCSTYDVTASRRRRRSLPGRVRRCRSRAAPSTVDVENKQYGIYLQDDWEVNDQLTLNLGVR